METAAPLMAERRENLGKGFARRLRMSGRIPAVCYGNKIDTIHISVEPDELVNRLKGTHGLNAVFQLDVAGETQLVRVASYQKDPVKRNVTHVDFAVIDPNKPLRLNVPLLLTGESQAVKLGGVLRKLCRTIPVVTLPATIPPGLELDITNLQVGHVSKVSILETPEGVKLDNKEDFGIVQVYVKRGVEVETEEDEAAAVAEE